MRHEKPPGKFSRYKVSAGDDLFTSVGFGLPNELCGRDSVENFTKKLRTLFRNENTAQLLLIFELFLLSSLTSFLYSKLDQDSCQNPIVFLV